MGKKVRWYVAFKKIFSSESKEKKEQKFRGKRSWGCGKFSDADRFDSGSLDNSAREALPPPPPPPPPPPVEIKRPDVGNEQNDHVYSVALASAVAAEAAAVAAQAAAQVARLTASSRYAGRSREETAAIKIQTAFRGYMARRGLRALRGLVRLKSLIEGNAVKRQAASTLRCMQTLARVQSQIRSRRIRMIEENQTLQRQLQLKRERELERLKIGEEWDASLQSREQIEANLLNKQEAAIRRERALAYAYSHQWKSSSRSVAPTFADPSNPHWGWSWLERWMAARPWENHTLSEKDLNDNASVKSANRSIFITGESNNASSRKGSILPLKRPSRSLSHLSPSTPASKASSVSGKWKSVSPHGWGRTEDDSRSTHSARSERAPRRQSVPGSSIRDDDSPASTPAIPSYMTHTESLRAKSRFQSHSTLGNNLETPPQSQRGSKSSAMKRLSFPETDKQRAPSLLSGPRRHSGPPKVNTASLKDVAVVSERGVTSNGASR